MIGEDVPLYPTGHLLYYAMLTREGVIAALPNTQKQTQGGCQNEETRKYGPNERTDQNTRIRTKQKGDKQHIRYGVQNTGYTDSQGT